MLFAYQPISQPGTYYTTIKAHSFQAAYDHIAVAWRRPFDGWIWEVDEKTKWSPPTPGQMCKRTVIGRDGRLERFDDLPYDPPKRM